MTQLLLSEITEYVENHIGDFHAAKLRNLESLKLDNILKRKNPYLFRAKGIGIASDLVKLLMDAFLSSQEETLFGDFLENLAIFVCSRTYGGRKSTTEGIDLEFERDGQLCLVAIKSGPNWGTSSQIKRMRENFRQAARVYRTNNRTVNILAINGCCYGRDNNPDKGDYQKLCGQHFWEFISQNPNLYIELIEPLGYKAKTRNEAFLQKYDNLVNRFSQLFSEHYCIDGNIDWTKLVRFSSESR